MRIRYAFCWRWFGLFGWLMCVAWACDEGPFQGVSGAQGKVMLGPERSLSKNASRIVVLVYEAKTFDKVFGTPRSGSEPIARYELTSLTKPPYTYQVDVRGASSITVYLMAFVDQDSSGGYYPSSGDLYGYAPADPAKDSLFTMYGTRLNIDITLERIFQKPALSLEVELLDGLSASSKARKLTLGLWHVDHIDAAQMPKTGTKPLFQEESTDLTKNKWTFTIDPKESQVEVVPFAFIDQDDNGSFSAGDLFGFWNKGPIQLAKIQTEPIRITISRTYSP